MNELLKNRFDRLSCGRSLEPKRNSPTSKENLSFVFETAEKRKNYLKKDIQVLKDMDSSSSYEKSLNFKFFFLKIP